jgi:biopolymer transport protein ExbB
MKATSIQVLVFLLASSMPVRAQDRQEAARGSFDSAAVSVQRQLEESIAELDELRKRIAEEKIPLNRKLSDLEAELSRVRLEYQQASRLLDSRTLDLSNLRSEIKLRLDEAGYLSNLLGEYIRNFESRLHIAEIQRYEDPLEEAKLAPENSNLTEQEIYERQAGLLDLSLERLFDALNGTRFEGTAVDSSGLVKRGTFVLAGPAAIFRTSDGQHVGTAEQRLGSLEPAVIGFANPEDALAAENVITGSAGKFPLDPTLGNAHKIEATQETLIEHIQKGGPVMVPIFALAAAALLVALYKWMGLAFIRKPSEKQIGPLLDAVGRQDEEDARRKAGAIKGPVGRMLAAGLDHLEKPRELIEEVMYETVLTTRLKLNRLLPFIAICAASAPLLGLLGTVTGIINTFKLITVFGSGDVKTLSGGISEALITTEFGLIVAIPSLLLHAFLSRKARGVIGQMETVAVAFANQVSKTAYGREGRKAINGIAPGYPVTDPDLVKAQVKEVLDELLASLDEEGFEGGLTGTHTSRFGSDGKEGQTGRRKVTAGRRDQPGGAVEQGGSSES